MSFTDGQPFVVTEDHLKLRWSAYPDARVFRCVMCSHWFEAGDSVRFVFRNAARKNSRIDPAATAKGAVLCMNNSFVCAKEPCDGTDVQDRLDALEVEGSTRFWWLMDRPPVNPRTRGAA